MDEYMTPTESAAFLRISRRTMDNWRGAGKGPEFHRIGGQIRYLRADLEAYARGQTTAAERLNAAALEMWNRLFHEPVTDFQDPVAWALHDALVEVGAIKITTIGSIA